MTETEKPPLTLWAFIVRLGGLGGRALYFKRITFVKNILAMFKAPIEARLQERHTIVIDRKARLEALHREHPSMFAPLGMGGTAALGEMFVPIRTDDKPIFLHLASDELLDKFFEVEAQQRLFEEAAVEVDAEGDYTWRRTYLWHEPKAAKLQVKLGKVIALEWTTYEGTVSGVNIEDATEWLTVHFPLATITGPDWS